MKDLWTYLQSAGMPVVMYGMGNGADKIISVLDRYNVTVSDFFASDGFVRGHSFRGKRVLSLSEVEEKYRDFIVLVSFGTSRPEVLENIYRIAAKHETYAPDVPVVGNDIFNNEFYETHRPKFESARELFCDARSKEVFDLMIEYKLTGRIEPLKSSECGRDEVFGTLLRPKEYKKYIDVGAYNGDTVRELYSYGANPERVIAVEPDPRTFKKLQAYAAVDHRVITLNIGVWSHSTTLDMNGEGNRNSGISGAESSKRRIAVPVKALDEIEEAHGADYIKYDVEGCEREALTGSEIIIRESAPDLLVSAYHRNDDLITLPELIHRIAPEHGLYLRRFAYVPAWDLNIIAVK